LDTLTERPPQTYAQNTAIQGVQDSTPEDVPELTITPLPTATPTTTPSANLKKSISTPVSTTTQILSALNTYRASKGIAPLQIDTTLQTFAQRRADYFDSTGSMDNHSGFQNMLNDNGFEKMGFNALGENSSFGAWETPQNLIESIYGNSSAHNESQLRSDWTHVGIGVKGHATNLVFGGKKR
ncbi:MAG TPA: CAP domain-containing protein, partial [Candidatus Levybacteria bacterium]|nr:CAP domain-containing protein [Candidatus Levybacteria bacterium]